jgi:phenylalanyl-tRNA synthetase alpha chain
MENIEPLLAQGIAAVEQAASTQDLDQVRVQ